MVDKRWETDRRETARRLVGDGDIQEKDGIRETDRRRETGYRRQKTGDWQETECGIRMKNNLLLLY